MTTPATAELAIPPPDLDVERGLLAEGHRLVAGIDEVGRGAWAGPMFVGVAVVDASTADVPEGTRDSKALTRLARRRLHGVLAAWCGAWAIGEASAREIDQMGLTAALGLAARRALRALPVAPTCVVVDGPIDFVSRPLPGFPSAELATVPEIRPVVKADATCGSVAAAAILAKVARDRRMVGTARRLPAYGFDQNMGYGTAAHAEAIATHGLSRAHRRSWSFAEGVPDAS